MLALSMDIAQIKFHPWILIPGVLIFVTVMAFNYLGDRPAGRLRPKGGARQIARIAFAAGDRPSGYRRPG